MLMWKLRRTDDLIDKINNIVDVEQNEIDDKDVEFKKFEVLFASKACDKSTIFDQLNDEFDAKFLMNMLLL